MGHRSKAKKNASIHIDRVVQRLERYDDSCLSLINDLLLGIEIRFAEKATLYTKINEAEAEELRAHRPIRKIQVLVEAAKSSTEWQDAETLPNPNSGRALQEFEDFKFAFHPRAPIRWWDPR